MKSNRIKIFDISKALAIIMVVYGHCSNMSNFVYLIHVPIFFIVSGYFFKEKFATNINNLFDFIKHNFIKLLCTYFAFQLIFIFLHNWFIDINLYKAAETNISYSKSIVPYYNTLTDFIKALLLHVEPLIQPIWFLYVLFFVSVIFALVSTFVSKIMHNTELTRLIIVLLFLLLGYHCYEYQFNIAYIGTIFSSISAYYVGFLFAKYVKIEDIDFYIFLFSFVLLIGFDIYLLKSISIANNFYYNPLLLLLLLLLGFVFITYIAKTIEKIKPLSVLFSYIGQNTIVILLFHLCAFKFVNIIKIQMLHLSPELLYQRYIGNDIFSTIIYVIAGVSLPLLANVVYIEAKSILRLKNGAI